jgi:hypothetical protein
METDERKDRADALEGAGARARQRFIVSRMRSTRWRAHTGAEIIRARRAFNSG